jgi:hypothetical protein
MQWHAKVAAVLTPAVLPVAVCDSVLALLTSVHSSARAGHVPTLLRTCNELTCVPVHALLHATLLTRVTFCAWTVQIRTAFAPNFSNSRC